jgi:hypothetical protein
MTRGIFAALVLMLALLFVPNAQAQRSHGGNRQAQTHSQSHASYAARGVQRGHGRNEGHRIDGEYRGRYFGRGNQCRLNFYGQPSFLFGGIWFGIDVWPSYWLATDYVYVDYYDGDYFLVNSRFGPGARIAILVE